MAATFRPSYSLLIQLVLLPFLLPTKRTSTHERGYINTLRRASPPVHDRLVNPLAASPISTRKRARIPGSHVPLLHATGLCYSPS
ncbi:hypothetical protein NDU88_004929 [Pleurodeles waltl]|uniref:Secreted protein n=1 Tax=Pleurodeles waltl TaxID=8319 RepID=A0AAV7MYM1_PLEWA|nr:hypothetical protein NDU88_004929 [Pleurodeles waltl]